MSDGCHRPVERFSVVRVNYLLYKLGPVAILARPAVNFIAAIVVPTRQVLVGIPAPDTQFRGFRCQPEFLLRLHDSIAGLHLTGNVSEIADHSVAAFWNCDAVDLPLINFANSAILPVLAEFGYQIRFASFQSMTEFFDDLVGGRLWPQYTMASRNPAHRIAHGGESQNRRWIHGPNRKSPSTRYTPAGLH